MYIKDNKSARRYLEVLGEITTPAVRETLREIVKLLIIYGEFTELEHCGRCDYWTHSDEIYFNIEGERLCSDCYEAEHDAP